MRVCVCSLWGNRSKIQHSPGWGGGVTQGGVPVYPGAWSCEDPESTHSSEWRLEDCDPRHAACALSLTSSVPVSEWSVSPVTLPCVGGVLSGSNKTEVIQKKDVCP